MQSRMYTLERNVIYNLIQHSRIRSVLTNQFKVDTILIFPVSTLANCLIKSGAIQNDTE